MTDAITLQAITLHKSGKQILDVADLTIRQGEVAGIVGPNGAGKSTLLKVMAMLEKPDEGTILLNGKKAWPGNMSIDLRRKTAVVFQQPLMLDTTVFYNVAAPLKFRGLKKKEAKAKVEYWLERFGVSHLAHQHARTLSGGESQRISLARAMVSDPEVLFLDEPFTALDLPTRKKLLQDFKQILKETNTTTLFISHDYQEVSYLCNGILLMFEGQFVKRTKLSLIEEEQLPGELQSFLYDWMTPLAN